MTFWDLTFEPYLNGTEGDEDGRVARAFLTDLESLLSSRSVVRSLPLAMRLEELLSATLKLRALEQAVRSQGVVVPEKVRGSEEPVSCSSRLLEPLAKLHERRRKALAEFEQACAHAGTPLEAGLPDLMRPILKQAEGVLEASLGGEDDEDDEDG